MALPPANPIAVSPTALFAAMQLPALHAILASDKLAAFAPPSVPFPIADFVPLQQFAKHAMTDSYSQLTVRPATLTVEFLGASPVPAPLPAHNAPRAPPYLQVEPAVWYHAVLELICLAEDVYLAQATVSTAILQESASLVRHSSILTLQVLTAPHAAQLIVTASTAANQAPVLLARTASTSTTMYV